MTAGTAPRRAALTILRRVREGVRFEQAFDLTVAGLSEADRRLVHEIAAGALRQRDTLDRQIDSFVTADPRRLEPDVRDLLRIGAYQLTRLDRVPPYAVLSATVEVAKNAAGRRAAGLVNAVLRRLAEAVEAGRAPEPVADLAAQHSHPPWLVERWIGLFGIGATEALLRHNNTPAPLTLQPAKVTLDGLWQIMIAANVPCAEAPLGMGLTVESPQVRTLPGYEAGAFVVQDAAHAWLLESVAIPAGTMVWDCCAAPGGKTTAVSRTAGHVLASDIRRDRLAILRDTVTRAAHGVSLFLADARRPPIRPRGVEVVLIDVPCSATGTMARHPDARWRLSADRIDRFIMREAEILEGAASAVSTHGILIYMTCSLEPEENGRQVDRFLDRHPDFRREQDDLFVFPPDAGTDGGYAARLRRVA